MTRALGWYYSNTKIRFLENRIMNEKFLWTRHAIPLIITPSRALIPTLKIKKGMTSQRRINLKGDG